ncbi:cytochrome P450 [Streptomyces sp. MB09-01]|uniref:cytochrome P450 n=1 Tax=Streptomyces sp. MB09-01 TaxID=3028666 RepID=UPI0029B6EF0A|nr:cytochrome P450 [Streptomyces sp. MB09-01]MDX3536745.1 cytochrome P450 [Streptomyces sp. MB09-01]
MQEVDTPSTVKGVPLAPGDIPLLGHGPRLLRDPLDWLQECGRAEPVLRLRLGPRPAYLVCCRELVHDMLVGRVNSFDKGGSLLDRARDLLGNGLVTAGHTDHRRQRRLMQPAFTPARTDSYDEVIREESAALTRRWRAGQEIDVLPELTSVTAKILGRTLLPTIDDRDADHLSDCFQILLAGSFMRAAMPFTWIHRLPTPANRRYNRAWAGAWAVADQAVAKARAQSTSSGLLHALITAGEADPEGAFSDEELRDQVTTLFIAGTETTAGTLAWLFHLLTLHPYVTKRLHRELDEVLGGRLAGPDTFPRLPYTRAVLLETMRVYPVVALLTRASSTDVDLGGHLFPTGTDFFFSAYLLHHDPTVFPDPDRFDPDRWTSPAGPAVRRAFIPFGAGKRKCIGDSLALTQATVILSAIASRWHLTPAPGSHVRPRLRGTLTPAGLRLVTQARHSPRAGCGTPSQEG